MGKWVRGPDRKPAFETDDGQLLRKGPDGKIVRVDQIHGLTVPGPVTMSVPVKLQGSGPREIELTFGGCTNRQCYVPVRNATLILPSS